MGIFYSARRNRKKKPTTPRSQGCPAIPSDWLPNQDPLGNVLTIILLPHFDHLRFDLYRSVEERVKPRPGQLIRRYVPPQRRTS